MPVMPPTAPSGLAVSDIGNGRAMATWADNSSDETGFKIERNPAFAGGAVTVTSNTTAYIDQCGPGDFSYRVSAVNDAGPSAWTPWAAVHIAGGGTTGPGPGDPGQTGSVGPDGWTIFNPSTDTRTVYVSSSMGSDGNDGLTEQHPKRTLAAAYELLRDGYPDWMLLKSGDTWHESMPTSWNKSGRSATEPIRIAQYGNGERPTLLSGTNCGIEWLALSPRQHIAITDLHLIGDGYTGSNNGIYGISLVGQWSDILVENCKIERYFVNASIQGQTDHWMTNIKVRRNVIVDAYRVGPESHSQGLFMAYCNGGLIEENVLDHNGWSETVPGADPTVFRHNVYVHPGYTSNMTERGNIVARGAASGLRSGGNVCEFNLCLKNPVNIVLAENSQVCRYNVVLDSRDILSSNPLGIGITAVAVNSEIYGNVVGYRTDADTWNLAGIQLQTGSHDSIIHNNVVYKWNGTSGRGSAVHLSGPMPGISIRNNVLNQAGGGHTIWCDPASSVAPSFVGNAYYSAYPRPFCTPQDQPIVEATYQQWLGVTGELGSNFGPVTLPQGERTIATYMQSLGMTPSLEAFLAEARNQSKTNWRREFTARAAGDYFREGFGVVVSMP
jgi:hypothetical protein